MAYHHKRGKKREITLRDDVKEEEESQISYLQPEILPLQVMVDALKERGMASVKLDSEDRLETVRLFYKHISPKFQRDYRDNRRGKILKRMRERKERKIEDYSWKKMVQESTGKLPSRSSSSVTEVAGGERLKPPLSCVDTSRKTIKLGGSTKTVSSKLDFVIKRKTSEEGCSENAKKLHISSNGQEKRKSDSSKEPSLKKMKEDSQKANDPEKKSDRKSISWP